MSGVVLSQPSAITICIQRIHAGLRIPFHRNQGYAPCGLIKRVFFARLGLCHPSGILAKF